jgi:hypothetical protein
MASKKKTGAGQRRNKRAEVKKLKRELRKGKKGSK